MSKGVNIRRRHDYRGRVKCLECRTKYIGIARICPKCGSRRTIILKS